MYSIGPRPTLSAYHWSVDEETAMTTGTATELETALLAAVDRWNAGDLDGYLKIYDEGIRLHGYSPEPLDKPAVRAFYEGTFAAFPGCQLTIHETIIDGERLSCRFTLTGRHDGEFMGCRPPGRTSRSRGSPSCTSATGVACSAGRAPICSECWFRSARCRHPAPDRSAALRRR